MIWHHLRHPLVNSTAIFLALFTVLGVFIGSPGEEVADGLLALSATIILIVLVGVMLLFTAWRMWSAFGAGLAWLFVGLLILMWWVTQGALWDGDTRNPLWLTASRSSLYVGVVWCAVGVWRKMRGRYQHG